MHLHLPHLQTVGLSCTSDIHPRFRCAKPRPSASGKPHRSMAAYSTACSEPRFLLHKRKACLAAANMSVGDGLQVDLRCNDVERQLWAKLTFSYGSDDVTAPRRHRCAKVGLR